MFHHICSENIYLVLHRKAESKWFVVVGDLKDHLVSSQAPAMAKDIFHQTRLLKVGLMVGSCNRLLRGCLGFVVLFLWVQHSSGVEAEENLVHTSQILKFRRLLQ